MTTSPTPSPRGCSATKEELTTRLSRIEGQGPWDPSVVEDDRYCIDVITQIRTLQAARGSSAAPTARSATS